MSAGKTLRNPPENRVYELHDLKLPFRKYVFDGNGNPIYLYHCVWEERTGRASELRLTFRYNLQSRLQAAWEGKRNLGQQVLELAVSGYSDAPTAEAAFISQLGMLIRAEK